MASTNETIKLIIRTANNKHADFDVELVSSATVYDLKQKLTLNHPTKPVPKDQRLIYSGKLLEDTSLLNQIFVKSTSGSSFMVHLVLDSDKNATSPKPPRVQSSPNVTKQASPPENPKPVSTPHSSTYEQYLEDLNRYQQQLQQFIMNPSAIQPNTDYGTETYLQYCYTHYQMYQNLLAYQRTVATPSTISFQQSTTVTSATTTTAPPPPAAAPPAAAAAGNNNNNNNEFEQENDLLGVLNMLVELFVLCSIIYFYSTLSRFLVVFLIFALLYLHCRGYLSIQRRRRAQVPPAPVNPEQAAGNDAGEDEVEAELAPNEVQNQNDVPPQRPQPVPPTVPPLIDNQISTTRVLLTAVSTFFSSLIPERPQRA